jgi:signal transduction histidine kinase
MAKIKAKSATASVRRRKPSVDRAYTRRQRGDENYFGVLAERNEAVEQNKAIAEILRIISHSPTELQPVFDTIARSAMRLCDTNDVGLVLVEGKNFRRIVHHGPIGTRSPSEISSVDDTSLIGRTAMQGRTMHVADVRQLSETDFPRARSTAREFGFRTVLSVPLLRGERAIGVIFLRRKEVRPFTDRQVALLEAFASQAVIAVENVRLFNETKEALERQTATAEILSVIASSPTNVQPVFEAIVESAVRLCGARFGRVYRYDGSVIEMVASHGLGSAGLGKVQGIFPRPAADDTTVGRAILTRRPYLIKDVDHDEAVPALSRTMMAAIGTRSQVSIPMLRAGAPIGAITMGWDAPAAFNAPQVALLQTFADQAVIAIENVRLFNETKESLEQQTATAEILKVISGSPTDVRPVFDAILKSAVSLCDAELAATFRFDGKLVHLGATHNWSREALEYFSKVYPSPPSPQLLSGRTILGKAIVQISDAAADPHYDPNSVITGHWRRMLGAPMLREGQPLGALVVAWREPGETPRRQVELLQTFADQAAIAIENVRLFNETKEALEQQTAISEVLRVISNSPADVQPVLDAVAERAARICEAIDAQVFLREGDHMKHVARFGPIPIGVDIGDARPLKRDWVAGRAVLEGKAIHIEDLLAVPREEYPLSHALRDRAGHRTLLSVPLMRERRGLGAISLRRMEVRPFTEKQITLVRTFADQAAIAIENVRLFNETKEALEQQTATSEILQIISGSRNDLGAVFAAILAKATALCEAAYGILWLREGDAFRMAALHGALPADQWRTGMVVRASPDVPLARVVQTRKSVHVPDMRTDHGYRSGAPLPVAAVEVAGMRTLLLVPMLKDSEVIGEVAIYRTEVRAFTERQIGLIENFADQAVIAIENVRLFREIQEKSTQLEIANQHKSDFLANMSHELRTPLNAIIGFSEVLSERMFGDVNEKQAEYLKDIHESGRHLLSLINDILDLSKIEAGRMELEVSTFDLPAALSNAMTLIRERAQRHGIELGMEVDPALGAFSGDERKFKQIMLNLLSNAVKFTPDGGKVDVSAKRANGAVEVAVRDTGIGIAPEDQQAVFEEFRQVGRDQMRKAEGTGLGLALTKRFVELHGGAIRLHSTPGQGSTFTVSLPLSAGR